MIDYSVTVAHMAVPLRWYYLLPLDVVGPGFLAAAMAFDSPSGQDSPSSEHGVDLLIFLVLLVLILFAVLGMWAGERAQQRLFLACLTETCVRTENGFKLEQATSMGKRYHEPRYKLQVALSSRASNSDPDSSPEPAPAGASYQAELARFSTLPERIPDTTHRRVGAGWSR